jgi:PKD repeat protein
MYKRRNVYVSLLVLLAISVFGLTSFSRFSAKSSMVLAITTTTDKQVYLPRQKATINGTVTLSGSPATDLLVIEQVNGPPGFPTYSFRTFQVGNPAGPWQFNVASIYLQDLSNNPIDTIEAGYNMQVGMTVQNLGNSASVFATITVYDADMASLGTNEWSVSIGSMQSSGAKFTMQVPKWACSGTALIIGCVYSSEPASGGIALCPEGALYYYISRTQSGLLGIQQYPAPPAQTTPGIYDGSIRLSADPLPGQYSVYVLGQSSPVVLSSATTSFNVQTTNGIPPQASFAYWPTAPAINVTVNFDASSSSPEGYGDIITKYDWYFGDGTSHVVNTGNPANPTASHAFTQATQYIVSLNVTNNEGLWCTTSKPITINLGYPPTANFTWNPTTVVINESVTFDASGSAAGSFATLVSYTWNFGDGTGIQNVSSSQTTHSFVNMGNYTVYLTVLDSLSRTASTSATLQVLNFTIKIYDINHDGTIDGRDITIVARAFGSFGPNYYYPGSPATAGWNPIADVNGDDKIDGRDITLVARNYGKDP